MKSCKRLLNLLSTFGLLGVFFSALWGVRMRAKSVVASLQQVQPAKGCRRDSRENAREVGENSALSSGPLQNGDSAT